MTSMTPLKKIKNKFEGERVFLIGNGPSLENTQLSRLNDEYTIALNKINQVYDDSSWRPSIYVNLLTEYDREYVKLINENISMGTLCFISNTYSKHLMNSEVYNINVVELLDDNCSFHQYSTEDVRNININELNDFWSYDISEKVYTYHSMYGVFQIASYLGFESMYLVGCDLGYGYFDPHMIFDNALDPKNYDSKKNFIYASYKHSFLRSLLNGILYKLLMSPYANTIESFLNNIIKINDDDHFSSSYRIQPIDLRHVNDEIEKSHIAANRIAEDMDINIYNATLGGNLEVYPRVSLNTLVNRSSAGD